MLESWIFWTLLAAVMQSVRTAAQKYLVADISAMAATLVRYLFGLPFALLYLAFLLWDRQVTIPAVTGEFVVYCLLAGVLQIVATVLLVRLFTLRNFAVGSCYVRTEVLITAVIGLIFFGEFVSGLGWAAMLICVTGLVLITVAKTGELKDLWNESALYGLLAGLAFSLTSLFIRQASLSFGIDDHMLTAAITLAFMVVMQTLISLGMVIYADATELRKIWYRWGPCLFVGATSVAGSAGWFTAFTLERAAYVKTFGQIEFLITLGISIIYFREVPNRTELAGMLMLVGGVCLLLLT